MQVAICLVVWMALGAGGLGSVVDATLATSHILQMRNWLQMIGVDAITDSAEVVELKAGGDRADE